jgi:hypothetical protein
VSYLILTSALGHRLHTAWHCHCSVDHIVTCHQRQWHVWVVAMVLFTSLAAKVLSKSLAKAVCMYWVFNGSFALSSSWITLWH